MGAPLGESFYNVDVNPADLWIQVGKVFERHRIDRKWRPIDVQRADGPSYKTVQAIENGIVGTVESLDKYARVLDLSIVDILQSVLAASVTPLTPEAAHVVRIFYGTTVAGRTAIMALSNALPLETVAAVTPLPAAGAPAVPRPPRPALPAGARRRSR